MSDAGRAVLIATVTPFAAFDGMTREIKSALEALGVPTAWITVDDIAADTQGFAERMRTWRDAPPRFVLNWNAKLHFVFEGQSVHDAFRAPALAPLLDHPADHAEHLVKRARHAVVTVCDRRHLAFLDSAPWPKGPTAFLPHGGPEPDTSPLAHADRTLGAVFCGNVVKPPDLGPVLAGALPGLRNPAEAAEELVRRAEAGAADAADLVAGVYAEAGRERPAGGQDLETFCHVITETNTAAVARRRVRVLNAPTRSVVHVLGDIAPDSGVRPRDTLRAHGRVRFDDLPKVYADTRTVLNVTPKFRDGGHERLFLAMAGGCALITDKNRYLDETLGPQTGVRTWDDTRAEDPHALAETIDSLAADVAASAAAAAADRDAYAAQHTWKRRAETMLALTDAL